MRINSATAWKEHAHKLSEKAIDRIAAEGIPTRLEAVRKAALALKDKFNLKYVQGKYTNYIPTKTERSGYSASRKLVGAYKPRLEGHIELGTEFKTPLGVEISKVHEALEKVNAKHINKHYSIGLGHNNANVIMQERKLINQAGIKTPNEVMRLRDKTGENKFIDTLLADKDRLRSSDYKKAARTMNKVPLIKTAKTVNENLNNKLKDTVKLGLQSLKEKHKRYYQVDRAAKKHGFRNPFELYNKADMYSKELQNLSKFRDKHLDKNKINEYIQIKRLKLNKHYEPVLNGIRDIGKV